MISLKVFVRVIDKTAEPNLDYDNSNSNPATSFVPYRVYNLGKNDVVWHTGFVKPIEDAVCKKQKRALLECWIVMWSPLAQISMH